MDKEELMEFLKDNLSISVEDHTDMYETGFKVQLLLDGDVISEDTIVTESNYDI